MISKVRRLGGYALFVLWTNIIYAFIVYYVFKWLAGHSLLYAHFGNLALIILGLAIDEYIFKVLQSKKLVTQLKQEKDMEKSYRLIQWIMDNFVSFKSILYLFYIFILIVSKIIDFNPERFGEDIVGFIQANDYSILFLLAFDTLISQFTKDRIRMKKVSEKLREALAENQEEGA